MTSKSWAKRSSATTGWSSPSTSTIDGVGGELDLDVVGGDQCRGDLVAGAAGAAHVDDDAQRVARGHAGGADHVVAEHADAGDGVDGGDGQARGVQRALEQRLAVDGELAAGGVERAQQQRARAGRAHEAHGARQPFGVDAAVARDVQHRASGSASRRSCGSRSAWRRRRGPARWAARRDGSRSAGPRPGRRRARRRPRARPRPARPRRRRCRSRWARPRRRSSRRGRARAWRAARRA